MKHVRDIMTADPACCTTRTDLSEVAKMMLEQDCGAIPIVDETDENRPIGIITDRDIVCRCVAQDRNPLDAPLEEIMSTPVVTVTSDTRVDECCHLMAREGIRRVPVVDQNGQLCGMVSQADIARFAMVEQKVEYLERISAPNDEEDMHKAA